ncbi:ATP-binding cassette domain-containing protein [Streptomyces spororaveus]|uniref:ATP-binding cassette domain-containing protein n=1 Tax=Streptomyces spororaveus TaxID=284039 RepID=UPI00207B00A5|nr:ATP-binding cassette domain-containing protein [Streptomyces spororaveus]MCM9078101.1 ABC transporter ATP-binding protein/permease [Streptomyces spororaveus]
MRQLWRTLRGHRAPFVVILAAEVTTSGLEALLHPLLLKALFDEAILTADLRRFLVLGLTYLALGLTLNLTGYWIACRRKRFENAFTLVLETELLGRALGLDGRKVSRAGNASYVSRIHNDVSQGVLPAVDVSLRIARQAVTSVVFLGVLLYLSWQASLVLLVIVPPLVFVSNRLGRRIEENTGPEREAEARYVNTLTRTLEAFPALRGLPSLLPGTRRANQDALRGFLGITFVNFRLAQRQRTLSDLVMNLSDTASMIVGAFFVFSGRMSFGSFLAFVNSLWRAVTGMFDLVNMIPQARRSTAVLERIESLRASRETPYHDEGALVRVRGARVVYGGADGDGPGGGRGPGEREVAGVSFDTFELRSGEHVLLRGPNGCGKTTLLHIISGTLAPDSGSVTLPPRVASLTAPVNLPPLPVRDLVPDAGLRAALDLDAPAGRLPSELSSGQRQRVGVAALLCEDADVYLADEPFANLDDQGRELVFRLLRERTAGRGLLVVHHGDEDLDGRFDRVVTLAAGHPLARLS